MALKLRRAAERFIPQSTRAVSFKRLLGAATSTTLPLHLVGRNRDCLVRPGAEGFWILEEFGGHLVVLHDFAALPVGLERSHSQPLELWAIGIIHLEEERIIGNECKKQLAGVDADSTEHATSTKLRHNPTQLINDECAEAGADRHTVIRLLAGA